MGGLIVLGLLGCSLHVEESGLLRSADSSVFLDGVQGESWELGLSGDAVVLSELQGHSAVVEGMRVGAKIHVRDWRVVAGSDGSAPYLGYLELYGANLVLHDRNSGARFVFDEASFDSLKEHVGRNLLVRGFIVGPHVLHVVEWEVLDFQGANGVTTQQH